MPHPYAATPALRAGLRLHVAHRLEPLAEALSLEMRRAPLSPPLRPEWLVMQSLGMQRWLSGRVAADNGVLFACQCLFPSNAVSALLPLLFPELPETTPYDPVTLQWRLYARLSGLAGQEPFEPLTRYLAAEGQEGVLSQRKRFLLAGRLAALFDSYLVFRPDWILRWNRGEEPQDWQACLWRALAQEMAAPDFPELLRRVESRLAEGPLPPEFPARIFLFGISALPPAYLHFFHLLSRVLPVHLFSTQPTPSFWGDASARKRLSPEEAASAGRHPLLDALGAAGRDFFNALTDLDAETGLEAFEPPAGDSLLARVQRGIFYLESAPVEAAPPLAADYSLRFHACHAPMREVEVLHDEILARFDPANPRFLPGLLPRDILVMSPDIEQYAPWIHAVFGQGQDTPSFIPYTVADRVARAEDPLAQTFLRLLELSSTRLTSRQVLELIEMPPLRERFQLGDNALMLCRQWTQEAGIRWGVDAEHRRALALPAFEETGWRHGLERLLLGIAMKGDGCCDWQGRIPCGDVEGPEMEILGRFAEAIETLLDVATDMRQARTLSAWADFVDKVCLLLFPEDDATRPSRRMLHEAADILRRNESAHTRAEPVEAPIIQLYLEQLLSTRRAEGAFLAGGITFCALKPMRSVPARFIALLGMNEESFPRKDVRLSFDKTLLAPRAGDRSARSDDRFLFLETLLAAREHLHLSYIGQSPLDGVKRYPSVVVEELLEHLLASHVGDGQNREEAREQLLLMHASQGYHPRYFDPQNDAFFSYSRPKAKAAAALLGQGQSTTRPFVAGPLLPPASVQESWRELDLSRLLRFLKNPSQAFCRQTLGIAFPEQENEPEESEPLEPNSLQAFQTRQGILNGQADVPPDRLRSGLVARGLVPPMALGEVIFSNCAWQTQHLAQAVEAYLLPPEKGSPALPVFECAVAQGRVLPVTTLRLHLHPLTLAQNRQKSGLRPLLQRVGARRPSDTLEGWLAHLAWQLHHPGADGAIVATLEKEGKASLITYRPLTATMARTHLEALLTLYWHGLEYPLPFYPQTSLEAATSHLKGKSQTEVLEQALQKWEATQGTSRRERDDPYIQQCQGTMPFPPPAFIETALCVWRPLLESVTAIEEDEMLKMLIFL